MERLAPRLLAIVFSIASLTYAQDINASMSGTITDSSGAVVPGAAVVITNSDTGVIAYQGKTNESGVYRALAAGRLISIVRRIHRLQQVGHREHQASSRSARACQRDPEARRTRRDHHRARRRSWSVGSGEFLDRRHYQYQPGTRPPAPQPERIEPADTGRWRVQRARPRPASMPVSYP